MVNGFNWITSWWLLTLFITLAMWLIWYQLKRIADVLEVMIVDVHKVVQETAEHIANQDAIYRQRMEKDTHEKRRSGNN